MLLVLTELGVLLAIFTWQAWIGTRLKGPLGALVLLQAGFWAVSYVARPAVLLVAQPTPQRDDAIADPRWAELGYVQALGEILPIVLLSSAAVVLVYYVATRSMDLKFTLTPDIPADAILAIVGIGWLARLASAGSAAGAESESGVLATVSLLASVGFGTHVLLSRSRGTRFWVYTTLVLLAGEFAWSVVSASKTPVLAALSWLLIAELSYNTRRVGKRVAVLVAVGLVAFSFIQGVKTEVGSLSSNEEAQSSYPVEVQPFLFLIRRLDLVSAVTDAVWAEPGSWISPGEASARFVGSIVPQQVNSSKKLTVGEEWANEVRARSVDNSDTGVHLAEGPVAEGYVLGGWLGVLIESLFIAALTIAICSSLGRRNAFVRFLAVSLTAQPLVLERGVLAVGEQLGKGLQVAVLCVVVLVTLRWVTHPRPRRTMPPPSRSSHPERAHDVSTG